MNKEFIGDIVIIKKAIENRKLVVFAGAGISRDSQIPTWFDLIQQLQNEIEVPKNETDYLRIAQMYFNKRQQKEYIEKIRSILGHKKTRFNEIHEAIFDLKPEHIVTTNFDDLLDQVIKVKAEPFSFVNGDSDFPYALNTNLLVKVHGDLNSTEIVLKEDDFLNYSDSHPLMDSFIKSIFASKVVLFVGYSFSDVNLKAIVQRVRTILGRNFQHAYLLSLDNNFHPVQREYFKNNGITVINYHDAGSQKADLIEAYLKGANSLGKKYHREGKNLSTTGQKLLNFLTFIARYNYFAESLAQKHLVEQMYESLARFNELKSLPPDFLSSLYPFSGEYSNWTMGITHQKTLEVFYENCVDKDGAFEYTSGSEKELAEKEKLSTYLNKIISVFNYSCIFFVKPSYVIERFDKNKKFKEVKRVEVQQREECNCLNCVFKRLDIKLFADKLKNLNITDSSIIWDDLLIAFNFCTVGEFVQSFKLFDQIATKAWETGKFISYYIAKQNSKYLRNLIEFYETDSDNTKRSEILMKIDDLDLDILINRISKLGPDEMKLLKKIKEDQVLSYSEIEIEKYGEKIIKVFELYSKGGTQIGPIYHEGIYLELSKIISFYTNNCVIADVFDDFKRTCQKAIEALITSYAIKNNYPNKVRKFRQVFCETVIFYGDAKKIEALLEKLKIEDLVFDEEAEKYLSTLVNNLLTSIFDKMSLGLTVVNQNVQKLLANDFFTNRMRNIFDNLFLILSRTELLSNTAEKLVPNLIDFLEKEEFLFWVDYEYIGHFIAKNHHLFDTVNAEKLVRVSAAKKSFYLQTTLIQAIFYVYQKNNFAGLTDEKLLQQILDRFENEDVQALTYLWYISNQEFRSKIQSRVTSILTTKFDIDLFAEGARLGVINPSAFRKKLLEELKKKAPTELYQIVDGEIEVKDYRILNLIFLIYKHKVEFTETEIKQLEDSPNYLKFFLKPDDFNYSNFDINWLALLQSDVIYDKLKSIKQIKERLKSKLRDKYDEKLGKIYCNYFL